MIRIRSQRYNKGIIRVNKKAVIIQWPLFLYPIDFAATDETVAAADNDQDDKLDVVRTKRVALKPMDNEEAILQMDMLGHDFFIYEDAETDAINIVYRRNDGRYGLIETDDNH